METKAEPKKIDTLPLQNKLIDVLKRLKEKEIDTSKLLLQLKYKELTKSKDYFETKNISKIINCTEYNLSDYSYYMEIYSTTSLFSILTLKEVRSLIPKIKNGEKYLPIFGYDLNKEKKFITNEKEINIISISCNRFDNFNLFKGVSRSSIAMKILQRNLTDEEEYKKLKFNNIFILNEENIEEEEIKSRLKALDLLGIKNFNNYFVNENEFINSPEFYGYDIKFKEEFFLLVDEKGIIKHLGEFDEGDKTLERKIKKLIKMKKKEENLNLNLNEKSEFNCFKVKTNEIQENFLSTYYKGFDNNNNKKEILEDKKAKEFSIKFQKFQKNFKNNFKSQLKSHYLAYINLQHITFFPFNQNKEILEEPKEDFKIKIKISIKDFPAILKYLKYEFKNSEIKKYNFNVSVFNRINILPSTGVSCSQCQIVIGNEEVKYFCYICNIHFCYECAMRLIDQKDLSALVHREHYLLAYTETNKDLMSYISRYKLGFNLYSFFDENDLKRFHNFGCDICGKCENGLQRYICLNCEEGLIPSNGLTDVCEICFNKIYIDGDQISGNKKHKKDHVYLWLVYNGEDYYNY